MKPWSIKRIAEKCYVGAIRCNNNNNNTKYIFKEKRETGFAERRADHRREATCLLEKEKPELGKLSGRYRASRTSPAR